ncbi:MAG: ribosomal protein S18-alanine N-acetyltransferase, partial [Nakamurella sp.]
RVVELEALLFPGDSPWTEAMFWSELAQGFHYVAVRGGTEVVGYAGLAAHPEVAEVQTIGVAPGFQGTGIGRRLLAALVDAAGEREIRLEVRTDNAPALGLYRSFGFELAGLRKRYYQPSGADAYTMVRTS